MRWALALIRATAPARIREFVAQVTYDQILAALAIVTVVPLIVALWAASKPESKAALWSVLLVQAVVALNVASHLASAAFLRGYGPGLATAVLINLPFSIYLFRRATRERWLSERAFASLIPAAIVVHGPLLIGVIVLSGSMVRG